MHIIDLLLLSVAMSMDAFAVSVCKGLSVRRISVRHMMLLGGWFGSFQALMPLIGFLLTNLFSAYIQRLGAYISCGLMMFIGLNMVKEALSKAEHEVDASFAFFTMLTLAIATSIDALATGVALNLKGANIALAAPMIGVTTGLLSPLGLKIGSLFGAKYRSRAELTGGVVLMGLGVKFLLEGLGVL